MKVPHTGSFFNSPPAETVGRLGPDGEGFADWNKSAKPFRTILMIARTTLITSTLAIKYKTARNIECRYGFFVVFVVGLFAPGLL